MVKMSELTSATAAPRQGIGAGCEQEWRRSHTINVWIRAFLEERLSDFRIVIDDGAH